MRDEEPRWLAWVRQTMQGIGPFAFVLMAYFALRFLIFGAPFKVYQVVPPINLSDPAWFGAKLYALKFFLGQSSDMTFWATLFLFLTIAQILVGLVIARYSSPACRVWVFGGCWLMAEMLPLTQQLFVAPTGEGARLLYIPGAALSVLMAIPAILITSSKEPWGRGISRRSLSLAGAISIIILVLLSFPLRMELLKPWLLAGQSMTALPASIAARAEKVPENGFAVLLIPDHVDGALFGRNGQGTLMEPPVQAKFLGDRILVVTPQTLREHAPRLALSAQKGLKMEYWCWNVTSRRFEKLIVFQHTSDDWLKAWTSSLRNSGFPELADELASL
jgi:hypothetical protein